MDTMKTPQEVYDLVWKEYMENEDGSLNKQRVVEALYSYAATVKNNSILYEYLSDGHITDPHTPVSMVMQASDDLIANLLSTTLQDVIQDLFVKGTMIEDPADRTLFYETAFNRLLTSNPL